MMVLLKPGRGLVCLPLEVYHLFNVQALPVSVWPALLISEIRCAPFVTKPSKSVDHAKAWMRNWKKSKKRGVLVECIAAKYQSYTHMEVSPVKSLQEMEDSVVERN